MSYSGWKATTIGDQITLKRGYDITRAKQKKGNVPVISSSGIKSFHDTARVNGPGVVLGRKGVVGSIYFVTENYWPHDTTLYVKDFKGNNPRFVYYFFKRISEFLSTMDVGSANPTLNRNHVHPMVVQWPSLPEQKTIAATLSCLDDKIELNNRINKNLEEIAQAIFKSWFVDFEPFQDGEFEDSELGRIPKGWTIGTLGDIANITMGQSPKGSSYNENGDGTVFYQGRTDFGSRYPTIRLYTREPKRIADKGDILLSVRAPVGDINIASEDCCIGRGLAALKAQNNCNSYLLYQLFNLKDSFNVFNGEGTVFGSINKNSLNNILVLIPCEDKIERFQFIAGRIDAIIENNSIQARMLTAIRDTLLPKLMSGEIRVPIKEVQ